MLARARPIAAFALPVAVLGAVLSPLLFSDRTFGTDWLNHLWLVGDQADAIAAHGLPTYWTHTDRLGVFYPQFVFYGGTLYAATGYLAAALGGSALTAYVVAYAAGFAMAYGGWTWLGRQAGLGPLAAQAPGVVHVTAAYVLSNAYARGSWPELMATCAIPLVAAAAWSLLRAPRVRLAPAAALVASAVVLTGAHNITLAWGATFLALVVVVVLVALGRGVRGLSGGRVALVAGLLVLAAGVNAWFLLPDVVYAGRTGVSAYATGARDFNTLAELLNPLRHTPASSTTPGLDVQMPVLALVWALAALVAGRRALGARWGRLVAGLAVVLALFALLVTRDDPVLERLGAPGLGLWSHLPRALTYVQFAFRLQSYVVMLVCALVLVGLVALARDGARSRWLGGALAAVLALGVALAAGQVWSVPSPAGDRGVVGTLSPRAVPPTWEDAGNFQDRSAPLVDRPGRSLALTPRAAAAAGRAAVPAGAGRLATPITAGAYLLDLPGLHAVGRDRRNRLVVAREPGVPRAVAVGAASHGPVAVGRALSVASLAVLVLAVVGHLAWARRPAARRLRVVGGVA